MIAKLCTVLLIAASSVAVAPPASAQFAPGQQNARSAPQSLEWTNNPGAFEQSLRRRYGSPLYAPSRRQVSASQLRNAIVRDASEARDALGDFVNLALDQRKLSYLKDTSEMKTAIATFRSRIWRARGIGGEASKLADELQRLRGELVASWRKRNAGSKNVQAALDEIERSIARRARIEGSTFIAQMLRKDSPIAAGDLASAMLSEDVRTIELAMRQLGPDRQQSVRREAQAVASYVRLEGAQVDGFQARLEALTGEGSAASPN